MVAVCGHLLLYDTTPYVFIVIISDMVNDAKKRLAPIAIRANKHK